MNQPISKVSVLAVLLWTLGTLFPVTAKPADQPAGKPLDKVRIVYSAISSSQLVGWVAYEAGFFKKNGLDVELIFIEGGPRAVRALTSGEVPFALVAGAPVLQSNLQGSSAVVITGFMNTMDYQFVVDKKITRPEQLKGTAVAVSQGGSSSDFATRYMLQQYGLEPGKDVTILEIGSQPARFSALGSGKIQGVMVAIPLTLTAKKMGFNILVDLQMLGLEYQYTALATTRDFIKARPDIVRAVVKSSVEAIHFHALVEAYEQIGLNLIPEKPYPTLRGIQLMLGELGAKDPKAKAAKPEQFVDMSFVKELDDSGAIDRLYKTAPVVVKGQTRPPAAPASIMEQKGAPPAKETQVASKPQPGKEKLAQAQESKASSTSQEYTVSAGDSLSLLALRYYGSAQKWPKIYEANKNTVKNPHYIYIGQKITIPPDVATT